MKRVAPVLLIAVLLTGCQTEAESSRRAAGPGEVPLGGEVTEAQPAPPATETEAPAPAAAEPQHGGPALEAGPAPAVPDAEPASPERTFFHFTRPKSVRGLYVNAWSAGSRRRLTALIDLAQRTEINSFVIDIKDASGYVSHPTGIPLAQAAGATGEVRIPSLSFLLARLEEAGIYPIARIVIVKDPLLAAARPDLAVQDTSGGAWIDDKGIVWLNPFNRGVWDYHIDLAREVAAMGFPEIQWDYVRFPDAPASALGRAHFPGAGGRLKTEAIRDFLAHSREALSDLDVRVTADVFGVTTSATRDVGIGQVWESFIDVVDVALPMVYPSHYWRGSFGFDEPNAHPYEIVRTALEGALRRSSKVEQAGTTRPWLQDFSLGKPPYDAPEVRAQIQAAHDLGIDEWILWNPGSRYTEAALEPVGGFVEEPLVRIANQLIPVSRRFELYDTTTVVVEAAGVEAAEAEAADESTDSGVVAPKAKPDTVKAGKGGSTGTGSPPGL